MAQERLRISHSSCCAFFKSQDFLAGIIKNFVVKLTGCLVVEYFSELSLPLKPIKIDEEGIDSMKSRIKFFSLEYKGVRPLKKSSLGLFYVLNRRV